MYKSLSITMQADNGESLPISKKSSTFAPRKMKIAFTTLGCKLNFAESSALGKALTQRGYVRAKQGEEADVCIINTCSVTDAADHKDRQAIHRIRRQNPNAILIVTGCYAQLKPGEIADFPEVDYVLGQDEKFAIPDLVERLEQRKDRATVQISAIRETDAFHSAYSRDDRTRCFLKVQDGCNYFCTYCTIPLARGKSRNPSIASLADEAARAIQEGAYFARFELGTGGGQRDSSHGREHRRFWSHYGGNIYRPFAGVGYLVYRPPLPHTYLLVRTEPVER